MGKRKSSKSLSMTSIPEEANDVTADMQQEVKLNEHEAKELMEDVNWFEDNPDVQADVLAVPLPDTPLKPPTKKGRRDNENAEILEAIRELSGKHDETFRKISAIERTTESTSKQMEKLTTTVQKLTVDVNQQKQTLESMKSVVSKLQTENKTLKADIADCQRYSRRWSLKIHGLREEEGEDIRSKIIDTLGKMAPKLRDGLKEGVDIVHRIGQRRQNGSSRSIIVLFGMRRYRDAVWKEAKGSKFLLDNKLRITEALSPEDKAAREKLWPLVKKAREEGKKASFRGPFALIDGKKIDPSEVT